MGQVHRDIMEEKKNEFSIAAHFILSEKPEKSRKTTTIRELDPKWMYIQIEWNATIRICRNKKAYTDQGNENALPQIPIICQD